MKFKYPKKKKSDTIFTDLERTRQRVEEFPPVVDPNVAQTELLDMVCKLVDLVAANVEANDGSPKELYRSVTGLYSQFWAKLRQRRPLFSVRPPRELIT